MNRKDSASESVSGMENGASQITLAANNDFTNYLFISNLYTQAKRHKEAVEAAISASRSASSLREKQLAELTLATAHQMSGDFPAAEQTLRNIIKETPGNPIALNNLGYFLVERNENLDEALNLIKQALKIDPTNSSYLDSLGWAYFKLNQLTEAEKYLKIALDFDTSSATLFEHLGDVLSKTRQNRTCRRFLEKGCETFFRYRGNQAFEGKTTNQINILIFWKKNSIKNLYNLIELFYSR